MTTGAHEFREGDRIEGRAGTRTAGWGAGRVTRTEGDRLFVKWDGAEFTEDEVSAAELVPVWWSPACLHDRLVDGELVHPDDGGGGVLIHSSGNRADPPYRRMTDWSASHAEDCPAGGSVPDRGAGCDCGAAGARQ